MSESRPLVIGDVVACRHDLDMPMTVEIVGLKDKEQRDIVQCVWFDKKNKLRRDYFSPSTLFVQKRG